MILQQNSSMSLALGIWPFQSLILVHLRSVQHGYHPMIGPNIQSGIDWLLSQCICYDCRSVSSREVFSLDFRFIAGIVIAFLLWQCAKYFPVSRTVLRRGEISTQVLRYPVFSQKCKCCCQQQGFAISLWRTNNSLGNSLRCLDISVIPFWSITQLELIHFWHWRFSLMLKSVQLEHNLVLFGDSIYIYFMQTHIVYFLLYVNIRFYAFDAHYTVHITSKSMYRMRNQARVEDIPRERKQKI